MPDFSYQGGYSLTAMDVNICSVTSTENPAPSGISISAIGGGSALRNGSLGLSASGQILLEAGSASLGLTPGEVGGVISILNGSPGSIVIAQSQMTGGPMIVLADSPPAVDVTVGVEGLGSAIKVQATGMKLAFGEPGAGASIEMGPAGLTLQYRLWKISFTEAGIEMSVGPNTINLQAAKIAMNGTEVEIAALTDLKLEALNIEESGSLALKTQSVLTTVG
jgi:hypothetical protein